MAFTPLNSAQPAQSSGFSPLDQAQAALGSSQAAMDQLNRPPAPQGFVNTTDPATGKPAQSIDWGNAPDSIPGSQIGKGIGTWWAKNAPTWLGGVGGTPAASQVAPGPTGEQIGGDVLRSVAIPAAIAAAPATITGAALAGAGIGAAQAGGQAMVDKGDVGQVAQQTAEGAALGGATGGLGGALGTGLQKLPSRLLSNVLPKLNPDNFEKLLTDTKFGTIKTMLSEAQSNANQLNSHIETELTKPEFAGPHPFSQNPFEATVAAFPQSEYAPHEIASAVREVVPGFSKLISKVDTGQADLKEINQLRQAIDANTKKRFTDTPQISNVKTMAAAFGDTLRQEVQSTAKATAPMFEEWSKELNMMSALSSASKKSSARSPINLMSLMSAMGGAAKGFSVGGPAGGIVGGLALPLVEEGLRTPGAAVAASKGADMAAGPVKASTGILANLASRLTGIGKQSDESGN